MLFNDLNKNLLRDIDTIKNAALEDRVPIIQDEALAVLAMLTRRKKPKKILEIGTAVGYSALQLSYAAGAESSVITIEKDSEMANIARKNFAAYDEKRQIELRVGAAMDVMEDLKEEAPFQMVFIDAAKGHYKTFFEAAEPLMDDGALIIADNVGFRGYISMEAADVPKRYRRLAKKMRAFNEWLAVHREYETLFLDVGDGISASWRL